MILLYQIRSVSYVLSLGLIYCHHLGVVRPGNEILREIIKARQAKYGCYEGNAEYPGKHVAWELLQPEVQDVRYAAGSDQVDNRQYKAEANRASKRCQDDA